MRTWQQLTAAAIATGTYQDYHGDGATVPYEMASQFSALAGLALWQYKAHLDATYPAAFKLHDWLYTPYGSLIGTDQDEADAALRDQILATGGSSAVLDSQIVFLAVQTGGGPWFGNSQTGFDQGIFQQAAGAIWSFQPMPFYKFTIGLQNQEAQQATGFSENWSFQAGSDTEARQRVQGYISARAEVLANNWRVGVFTRLSRYQTNCRRFKPQSKTKYCCVPRMESRVRCTCPTPLVGRLGVGDQGWDGVLIELCTEPWVHTGCSKCQTNASASIRNWIMRAIPDTWFSNGTLAVPTADRGKVEAFIKSQVIGTLKAGVVGCSDACSDDSTTSCTAASFAPFTAFCPNWQSARKRSIGRPFTLLRGRRSKRKTAT